MAVFPWLQIFPKVLAMTYITILLINTTTKSIFIKGLHKFITLDNLTTYFSKILVY